MVKGNKSQNLSDSYEGWIFLWICSIEEHAKLGGSTDFKKGDPKDTFFHIIIKIYFLIFSLFFQRLSCNNLYRFVNNNLNEEMWNHVFGGGTKVVIPAPETLTTRSSPIPEKRSSTKDTARMKWNYKLLGKQSSGIQQSRIPERDQVTNNNDDQKLVRHELYIPPKLSLCDYFLKKVTRVFMVCLLTGHWLTDFNLFRI